MSKEDQDIGGNAAGRQSVNNGSELMLNHNSTAEREHSQNPHRSDSAQVEIHRKPVEPTEVGGDSLSGKNEKEKHSASFNVRRRSSSHSVKSKEMLASTPGAEKEGDEAARDNRSLSDAQDDGLENLGDDEQGSEHEAEDSNLNIMEKFRLVMKEKMNDGSLNNQPFGPPPEELIRKSAMD